MDFVSWSRYLKEETGCPEPVPFDVLEYVRMLLRGIGVHAFPGDPDDLTRLKAALAAIAQSFKPDSSGEDLLVGIHRALRAFEEYNQKAAEVVKVHTSELRTMLGTMTETVKFLSSSSETSVKQLGLIETKLQRAATLEDTRQLRLQMNGCLVLVRNESLRVQAESNAKVNALKADVERLSNRIKAGSNDASNDAVSGLPARAAAEDAIANKISSGREFVTALFVMDRLASINGKFGRLVGDEILLMGAQHLARKLTGAALYRWSGPSFVGILDVSGNAAAVENQAKQAGSMRFEKSIDAESRSILLLVTCSFLVQRVTHNMVPDAVFRSMDAFLAANFKDPGE